MNDLTINQLTPDELHALGVQIAGARSRITAPHWEPHEVVAVLRGVSHELVETMRTAGLNAANDQHAERPVTITFTRYRPKPDEHNEPDRGPHCDICGRTERMCQFVGRKYLDAEIIPDAWHPFVPVDLDSIRRRYAS